MHGSIKGASRKNEPGVGGKDRGVCWAPTTSYHDGKAGPIRVHTEYCRNKSNATQNGCGCAIQHAAGEEQSSHRAYAGDGETGTETFQDGEAAAVRVDPEHRAGLRIGRAAAHRDAKKCVPGEHESRVWPRAVWSGEMFHRREASAVHVYFEDGARVCTATVRCRAVENRTENHEIARRRCAIRAVEFLDDRVAAAVRFQLEHISPRRGAARSSRAVERRARQCESAHGRIRFVPTPAAGRWRGKI